MGFIVAGLTMMFGSPFSIILFGTGVIVGYLLSENQRTRQKQLEQAYDELNDMLLEKEGRIDKLEEYIDRLHQRQIGEPAEEKTSDSDLPSEKKDDLTLLEGIGRKSVEILNNSGIHTFKDLSETSLDSLTQILEQAGPAYLRHGHETWAKQSLLAANGEWEALKSWQKS